MIENSYKLTKKQVWNHKFTQGFRFLKNHGIWSSKPRIYSGKHKINWWNTKVLSKNHLSNKFPRKILFEIASSSFSGLKMVKMGVFPKSIPKTKLLVSQKQLRNRLNDTRQIGRLRFSEWVVVFMDLCKSDGVA